MTTHAASHGRNRNPLETRFKHVILAAPFVANIGVRSYPPAALSVRKVEAFDGAQETTTGSRKAGSDSRDEKEAPMGLWTFVRYRDSSQRSARFRVKQRFKSLKITCRATQLAPTRHRDRSPYESASGLRSFQSSTTASRPRQTRPKYL